MFSALLDNARGSRLVWHGRLFIYWLKDRREGFALFALLCLPFVAIGTFIYIGYSDQLSARLEAYQKRTADLHCLAENVYHEARGEPFKGQIAVAEVTLNRVASPYFPKTICDVVHEARWDRKRRRMVGAFSWTEIENQRKPRGAAWREAKAAAEAVYDRDHAAVVPGALYYHATYIRPKWARQKKTVATIGNHVFYR
jgi:spore germination cell wall hydrolase CwlJ-like protein